MTAQLCDSQSEYMECKRESHAKIGQLKDELIEIRTDAAKFEAKNLSNKRKYDELCCTNKTQTIELTNLYGKLAEFQKKHDEAEKLKKEEERERAMNQKITDSLNLFLTNVEEMEKIKEAAREDFRVREKEESEAQAL